MMSPSRSVSAVTGRSMTSEPLWIVGSIEPPVTTKLAMPSARMPTKRSEKAKSTTMRALIVILMARVMSVVLLSFRFAGGGGRSPWGGRPGGEVAGRAGELGRRVRDREVLGQRLHRVAGRGRQRVVEGERVRARGRRDRRRGRERQVLERAGVEGRGTALHGDLRSEERRVGKEGGGRWW